MRNDVERFFTSNQILDSIGDGVYVTDLNRKIVYWNKAAERITGWRAQDVIGKSCMDGILCHQDKESRPLCGKDTCPLHRAIITGAPSSTPLVVSLQRCGGGRLPVEVNVAPIKNEAGEIIGGVEVFRSLSDSIDDLKRAKKIQRQSFKWNIAEDAKLKASIHYLPHGIIGGDYYAVQQLSRDQYVFLLADVMGHGVSAALYTMYIRALFDELSPLLPNVSDFIKALNNQLYPFMHDNFSFASFACGMIDLHEQRATMVGGAHPSPFIFHRNTSVQQIEFAGFALGMRKNSDYVPQTVHFGPGDVLFLYTDGAIENPDRHGETLNEDGLIDILKKLGYPHKNSQHQQVEKHILQHAVNVKLKDDMTFLEFLWPLD